MNERVYLGMINRDKIYLYKHTWECDWYWGFGYLRNTHWHFHLHIESLITGEADVKKIFSKTKLSQSNWWVIRDLFIQAYALKRAAEVYQLGGHNATLRGYTDILRCPAEDNELITRLNTDLERILDKVWEYINNIGG